MTNDPHICIITSSDISESGIGGDGRYSILLYKWLKNKNINCTLLGSKTFVIRDYGSSFVPKGTILSNKSQKKTSFAPYPLFMAKRLLISVTLTVKILQLHISLPISLIHSQDTGYTGLAAIIAGKILRVPVVVSSHGIRHKTIQHGLKSKLKRIIYPIERNLDTYTIKAANEVVVDNDTIKYYFEKTINKRINTIPIPIQQDKFEYSLPDRNTIRTELGLDESFKVVGFIGRFAPEKNLISLIIAFSSVLQNSPQARLVLVGTGPMESEMKNLVNEMNMSDKVIFCGVRNDVNKILSACDIFILPSFVEGMSVALLEAMAAGRSIICSNIPTNAEIITHRRDGILVDPNNIKEIENAILELLDNAELRSELSSNAKKRVLEFGINMIFPKVINIYENQIGKSLF